ETLVKSGREGGPTDELDDYLAKVSPDANWAWADLGATAEPWRPLRTEFAADPLPSVLSTLEGLAPGNDLAAVHLILRPAAGGWQAGGQAYAARLRGDNVQPGQPRPRLGGQERELIKRIEAKGKRRGYDLCLRLLVAGTGDVGGNLE